MSEGAMAAHATILTKVKPFDENRVVSISAQELSLLIKLRSRCRQRDSDDMRRVQDVPGVCLCPLLQLVAQNLPLMPRPAKVAHKMPVRNLTTLLAH